MKNQLFIAMSVLFLFSCKKEEVTPNNPPSTVTNFSIEYGSDDTYNWSDATDADGDAVTYDLYLLMSTNDKPTLVASDLTSSQYIASVSYVGTLRAMIVVAKDGKGGKTTSVEYPTIIL